MKFFGRDNFRSFITWQRKYSVSNNFQGIASICDYILVYSKSSSFKNNLLARSDESKSRYNNPDNDPRGSWKSVDYLNQATPSQRPNLCYDITNPNTGKIIRNTKKAWKYDPNTHKLHVTENRIWWGLNGKNTTPALKLFLSEVRDGMTPHNWWSHQEVGPTDEAIKESINLFVTNYAFSTPKPERLIQRVLELTTNENDIVPDSFLGRGTTAAVAHKMKRKWIGIELGNQINDLCFSRLLKVLSGKDNGGISEAENWKGGGGFKFCTLPGLVVLKLIAWNDSPEVRRDDIRDISDILNHFFDMYDNEIWENHNDLFVDENADLKHIAAKVMGREMSKIARRNQEIYGRIEGILNANTDDMPNSKMAAIMIEYFENTVEDNVFLLQQLRQGFRE